ncbi:hypothetical protein HFP51_10545 [Parasphingopyxis sp. CP4]|nr:hypothetical protein [Parasphingopyxis sp. CP4]QLC23508.1 hypothetical protein HFP51_10545 [Parasphingopyxis sp. CP4]
MTRWFCLFLVTAIISSNAQARDSLGVYEGWAAFRDAEIPRCYAIARPERRRSGEWEAFASIGTWPARNRRGQVHFRLRRAMRDDSTPILTIGPRRFELVGSGPDAWAATSQDDAAIVAAMRNGLSMRIEARSRGAGRIVDNYDLSGAASAIDAAALGCTAS